MFVMGESIIGDYKLWITTPMGTVAPDHEMATQEPYFEILFTNCRNSFDFYEDPTKEDWINLNLSDRNPLAKVKDKENPTDLEKEFRVEYEAKSNRKEQIMPLTKLSKRHVFQLLELLFLIDRYQS